MYVSREDDALAEYARGKALGLSAEWPMLTRLLRGANTDPAALKAQFVVIGADKARTDSVGRQIFALGSNPTAAPLRGINVTKVTLLVFAISGAVGLVRTATISFTQYFTTARIVPQASITT